MTFKCLGTGSSGNCYLVTLDGNSILLDAGVPITKIIKTINLNDIAFAFISHDHKDHSESAEKLRLRCVPLLEGKFIYGFTEIKNMTKLGGNTKVFAFPVEHGDCPCSGIIIKSDNECILYITDFTICKYNLASFKFTSVIVECNYITEEAISNNNFVRTKENIYRHLSLDGCDLFLSKLDLTECKGIYLTHFSENFSNPIRMGCYINDKYKIPTHCCRKNGGYDTYE